jgi:hypothetical protein
VNLAKEMAIVLSGQTAGTSTDFTQRVRQGEDSAFRTSRDTETGAGGVRLHHGGPQGAKPKLEVIADILASIKERAEHLSGDSTRR